MKVNHAKGTQHQLEDIELEKKMGLDMVDYIPPQTNCTFQGHSAIISIIFTGRQDFSINQGGNEVIKLGPLIA